MTTRFLSYLALLFATIISLAPIYVAADILPSGSEKIKDSSILVTVPESSNIFDTSRSLGVRLLSAAKILISGFALLYIVLIGVYMVTFSDNEDRIKAQRKQFIYTLVGFLFLNLPSVIYDVFFTSSGSKDSIGGGETNLAFWNVDRLTGTNGIIPMITGFFEVFIFGVAIVSFTYGLFRLIMSGGDDERQKAAKNKILYGTLGLIFLGFVRVWGSIVASGDFKGKFATVGSKMLGLALYFAGPVAIFFIVLAAYYYLTSAGDEERTKKAKSILVNTFIASLILLAAYSFFSDIIDFSARL